MKRCLLCLILAIPFCLPANPSGRDGPENKRSLEAKLPAPPDAFPDDENTDTITDIDGNHYATVRIGDQLWMKENLRVTRFSNGDTITTGLSNEDWANTDEPAYAIYEDDRAILNLYGKLYNWYAAADERNICPAGWAVPDWEDVDQMISYLKDEYGWTNDQDDPEGIGNQLKSCRQVGSPIEDCDTDEHPRWDSHDTHYGRDGVGFSGLPAGLRSSSAALNPYSSLGSIGAYWTTSPSGSVKDTDMAFALSLVGLSGAASYEGVSNSNLGYSIRCIKVEEEETFSVTFEVDMTYATNDFVGFDFDPDEDEVYVVGDMFGSWIEPGTDEDNPPMTRKDDDSMVFVTTLELPADTYEYKYVMNEGWSFMEWGDEAHRELEVEDEKVVRDWFGFREDPTGVTDERKPIEVEVYPNPARNLISVKSSLPMADIRVFDLQGREVKTARPGERYYELHLERLDAGLYIMRIQTEEGMKTLNFQVEK